MFLDLNNECDDGNIESGDGCSDLCTLEVGYRCENGTKCKDAVPPLLQLVAIEEPNVLYLQFDEEVFITTENGLSKENLKVKVQGPA